MQKNRRNEEIYYQGLARESTDSLIIIAITFCWCLVHILYMYIVLLNIYRLLDFWRKSGRLDKVLQMPLTRSWLAQINAGGKEMMYVLVLYVHVCTCVCA